MPKHPKRAVDAKAMIEPTIIPCAHKAISVSEDSEVL